MSLQEHVFWPRNQDQHLYQEKKSCYCIYSLRYQIYAQCIKWDMTLYRVFYRILETKWFNKFLMYITCRSELIRILIYFGLRKSMQGMLGRVLLRI